MGYVVSSMLRQRHLHVPGLTLLLAISLILNSPSISIKSTVNQNCSFPRRSPFTYSPSLNKNISFKHFYADLLYCGDVLSQPGPRSRSTTQTAQLHPTTNRNSSSSTPDFSRSLSDRRRKIANPCTACLKGVTKASKAVSCDSCEKWTHVDAQRLSVTNTTTSACPTVAILRSHVTLAFGPLSPSTLSTMTALMSQQLHPPTTATSKTWWRHLHPTRSIILSLLFLTSYLERAFTYYMQMSVLSLLNSPRFVLS